MYITQHLIEVFIMHSTSPTLGKLQQLVSPQKLSKHILSSIITLLLGSGEFFLAEER